MDDIFLKAYSIKQVSSQIEVTEGTIRQWEKDFNLDIPRSEDNSRYFTEIEIETLSHIKAMRDKNLSKAVIKDLLDKNKNSSTYNKIPVPDVPALRQTEATQVLRSIQQSFETFPEIKKEIMNELKDEIKESIKEELTENFKKQNELIAGELKKITDSQKQVENTKKTGFLSRIFKK